MDKGEAAIISIHDKQNLEVILEAIGKLKLEIIATSGTAKHIRNLGYKAKEVSEYLEIPEAPEGLIKTLHPKIYAGILLQPENPLHREYMEKIKAKPIVMVIVNFYPPTGNIEDIDIGGVTLARAAAKAALRNGKTIVLTSPKQYSEVAKEIMEHGWITRETAIKLAIQAFQKTSQYENETLKRLEEKMKWAKTSNP